MKNDIRFGIVLGVVVATAAIAGNVGRSDAHLVSLFPGVITAFIVPVVVYVLSRRRRIAGQAPAVVRRFGLRIGIVAGGVFAIGTGTFTRYWFPAWSMAAAIGAGTAFLAVVALSCFSAYLAGTTGSKPSSNVMGGIAGSARL